MFFIGLAAGALIVFILVVIYSSLAVAARADREIRSENWEYYQDDRETENAVDRLEPAFFETEDVAAEMDPAFVETEGIATELEPAFLETVEVELEPVFVESTESKSEIERGVEKYETL